MYQKPKHQRGIRFFPTFIMEDLFVIMIFMVLLSALVFYFPEWVISGASEVPADPFNTPEHIKPEWYFLASYQLLKIVPSKLGAILLLIISVLLVLLLPFLDRGPDRHILDRPIFLGLVVSCIALFIGLTIWGAYS